VRTPGETGGPGEDETPVHQETRAARDSYAAGRDQYLVISQTANGKTRARRLLVAGVAVVVISLLAVFIPRYVGRSSASPSASSAGGSELVVDSVAPSASASFATHELLATPPAVKYEFKLSNIGSSLAFITGVFVTVSSVKVSHYTSCPTPYPGARVNCGYQVPVSGKYLYTLPLHPGPAYEVSAEEAVPPDEPEIFVLTLELPVTAPNGRYEYKIHLSLAYNKTETVNAGYETFTVAP
jgi:hypothetical protein